jgi:hypothetical protein
MTSLAMCKRGIAAALFLIIPCGLFAQLPSNTAQEPAGILRGEMSLPSGLFRPHPFILAYSASFGAQTIPADEHGFTARFEVKLRPGTYYIFVALDGWEPTCYVAEIVAGEVIVYNPKLGPAIMITEYGPAPVRTEFWQLPPFGRLLPTLELSPLPPK